MPGFGRRHGSPQADGVRIKGPACRSPREGRTVFLETSPTAGQIGCPLITLRFGDTLDQIRQTPNSCFDNLAACHTVSPRAARRPCLKPFLGIKDVLSGAFPTLPDRCGPSPGMTYSRPSAASSGTYRSCDVGPARFQTIAAELFAGPIRPGSAADANALSNSLLGATPPLGTRSPSVADHGLDAPSLATMAAPSPAPFGVRLA